MFEGVVYNRDLDVQFSENQEFQFQAVCKIQRGFLKPLETPLSTPLS